MVPGSNTKPSEENIGMFETAVMVAVVDVLCYSFMSEEHNIYLLLKKMFFARNFFCRKKFFVCFFEFLVNPNFEYLTF